MNVSIDLTTIEKLFSAEDKEPLREYLINRLFVHSVKVKEHPLVKAFLGYRNGIVQKEDYDKSVLFYTKSVLIPVANINVDQDRFYLALTYEHFDQFTIHDIKNLIKYSHSTTFNI